MIMRIALFLLTNLAVIVVASLTLNILGVGSYLDASGGLDLNALLAFSFVFGMSGAVISLFLSKFMAKMATRTKIIKSPNTQKEAWLVDTVAELARKSNIGMPEVGIFPADQANAFATGWNKNNALVAVSQGMLDRYSESEVEAVMAHEIAHVANGDMITLTLIQGVINTFVMFFARIIGHFVDRVILKNEEEGHGIGFMIATIVAEIILAILASVIVMWFSRRREYRADEGAAYLVGAPAMIGALAHLQRETAYPDQLPESMNAFGINSGKREGIKALFMSHPPLEDRINALKKFA